MLDDPRSLLKEWFQIGVRACSAEETLPPYLPTTPPKGRSIILGAGKAAAQMAGVVVNNCDWPHIGAVVTRYGHGTPLNTDGLTILEASHPTPDENSHQAAIEIAALAKSARADDRVIFLFSGGGSALLMHPIDGVSRELKREISAFLVKSGAPIEEINLVRRHLSTIKGGKLSAMANKSDQLTFLISDVVGDAPEAIASGPSIACAANPQQAISILQKYHWPLKDALKDAILNAQPATPRLHPVHIICRGDDALSAIEKEINRIGCNVVNLGAAITGDVEKAAKDHAALAANLSQHGKPVAVLSGGELTVSVQNPHGKGGPNLEYLTHLMSHMPNDVQYAAIACDSDGIDGTQDNAGGYIDHTSQRRALAANLPPMSILAQNNSYELFDKLGDLIITGPTKTNVNDIRILLLNPS